MNARAELVRQLRSAVSVPAFIQAAWLEGSDARGRVDGFSDVDLWLDVRAGDEEAALHVVREVVLSFGALSVDEEIVHTDPLIRQRFLGSVGLSPFHFVDLCVQTHGREVGFTAADPYLLWIDRSGVIRQAPPQEVDVAAALTRLNERKWWAVLVEKEVRRGHTLEALAYYREQVLPLLVQFLRLKHSPQKQHYSLKHIHHELPPEDVAHLLELQGYSTPEELRTGVQAALDWMEETEKEIRGEP